MTVGIKDAFAGTSLTMEVDTTWASSSARNGYTGETVSIAGLNRSFDTYDGQTGGDLTATPGNDALLYSTLGSGKVDSLGHPVADAAHFTAMVRFFMGAGDDVLDLTSPSGGGASYAGNANLIGNSGKDVLWGGSGADMIFGDSNAAASVYSPSASPFEADQLIGGAGQDTIVGDVTGTSGTVTFGDDLIDGGTGNDLLLGDLLGKNSSLVASRGHNTFRFDGPGSGQDQIGTDTNASNGFANGFQHGLDHLQLKASYGYTAAQALAHTADNGSGNAVVDLGNNDSITLVGVHKADLTASDFVIA